MYYKLNYANSFFSLISRYVSSHHNRSQSVRTPGSKSNVQVGINGTSRYRPNYLCLPQQRTRVASMPNTGVEEEYYRLRQFSISGKGIINRGDSLKSRRSRSNTSVASSNSSHRWVQNFLFLVSFESNVTSKNANFCNFSVFIQGKISQSRHTHILLSSNSKKYHFN